jgi:hypothetical protein
MLRSDTRSCPLLPTLLLVGLIVLMAGCGGDAPDPGAAPSDAPAAVGTTGGAADLHLIPSPGTAPDAPDARMGFVAPEEGARFAEGEPVEVTMRLTGYDLHVPTPGGDDRGLARAPDGQHVHLILNDREYRAIYDLSEPVVFEDLPAGTHVLRVFPGRDWHESVKTPGAFAMRTFHVGDGDPAPPMDLEGPLLTYSRPVGEYAGAAADSILVDFYLSGVRLSPEGFRVRVEVDGVGEALINQWAPHLLVGLPDGDHRPYASNFSMPQGPRCRESSTGPSARSRFAADGENLAQPESDVY